ncbi:hypothetical protein Y032_0184g984 [Ancylostoma ceylanicum]|uniref:Uncharacterized protein n=1 Tax=Ancylostoma ceylanicum TaxID=53326 RepID=A0A016SRR6_9BILA|nr:hypothetical protein Y032_0184g984 [Ancylostoma ceylanicum]
MSFCRGLKVVHGSLFVIGIDQRLREPCQFSTTACHSKDCKGKIKYPFIHRYYVRLCWQCVAAMHGLILWLGVYAEL